MKTKKIMLSMAIIALSMFSLQGYSQVKFGIKADVGLNNPTFSSSALKVENLTTYSVGPSLEAMFPMGALDVGLDASLLYNDNRMTVANLQSSSSEDVTNRYIQLPLNAKIKFGLGMLPIRMFATAGPYAGYLIEGDKIDLLSASEDIRAKKFSAGANVGAGFELFNMVQLGVNYSVKLTDDYSTNEPNWNDPLNGKTNAWSITGTVYF
ncbi:MAG: outer membrane beta-barrel protein [Petrimonas sp.]|nr:outer membrane beta-barrel protein [Petrimonas sp.]